MDRILEVVVEVLEFVRKPVDVTLDEPAHTRHGPRQAVLLRREHLDELPTTHNQVGEFARVRVRARAHGRSDGLTELCQDRSVDGVGLGKSPRGLGEVPHLPRVDHCGRHLGRRQRRRRWNLETTGRLKYDQARLQSRQPFDKVRDAGGIVADGPLMLACSDLQQVLGDVDANEEVFGAHGCSSFSSALHDAGSSVAADGPGNCSSFQDTKDVTTHATARPSDATL